MMAGNQIGLFGWDDEPEQSGPADSRDAGAEVITGLTAALASASTLFSYNGFSFAFDERQFINLTQMWKAAGSPINRDPREWRRQEGSGFIADLARSLNVGLTHIILGERGRGGATHAHWQVSVAYAKYLSHEFHRVVNEAFRRQLQEELEPGLKLERGVKGALRRGWSAEMVQARVEGIVVRNFFTETLQRHGVKGVGFAKCTDAINRSVLGMTAQEFKKENGLPRHARTRDHMEPYSLTALAFTEATSRELIEIHNPEGNNPVESLCGRVGDAVSEFQKSLGLKK